MLPKQGKPSARGGMTKAQIVSHDSMRSGAQLQWFSLCCKCTGVIQVTALTGHTSARARTAQGGGDKKRAMPSTRVRRQRVAMRTGLRPTPAARP
eukprot:11181596-Lingulodinium_polyedra.AAC.1